MITHLVTPEDFDGDEAVLEGDGYRHLFRARRLARGAEIRVVDGTGRARLAVVDQVERRRATLRLGDATDSHEPSRRLHLIVAALRSERASWLVEKTTELGVASIHFVRSDRTPRQYGEGMLDRLRRVAAAAVVQCHRALVPEITGVHEWSDIDDLLQRCGATHRLILDTETSTPLVPSPEDATALIGPEGGWSPKELQQLRQLDCRGVGFGDRVLRVETAAVAMAARWLT